jgi:hypothetical protein
MRIIRRVFSVRAGLCLLAAILAAGPAALARGPEPKQAPAKPASSGAGFVPDKGKFRILLNGQLVGTEEFEISSSDNTWSARDSTTMRVPGSGEIRTTGQLRLAADGTPIHYDWTSQADKKASGAVDFANGTAKTAIDLGGKTPFTQDFMFPSPRIAVLDNNLYNQYAVLAKLYDWKTGGKQVFPVLIPQDMTPGSISVQALGSQRVENSDYEALRVSSPDLEIVLYLDSGHRLMRLEVPASKVTIQRE